MPYRYVLVIEHFGNEYCVTVDKDDFDYVLSEISKEHEIHQVFWNDDEHFTTVYCRADSPKGRTIGFYYLRK